MKTATNRLALALFAWALLILPSASTAGEKVLPSADKTPVSDRDPVYYKDGVPGAKTMMDLPGDYNRYYEQFRPVASTNDDVDGRPSLDNRDRRRSVGVRNRVTNRKRATRRSTNKRLAKIDLDGDFNYDGTVVNSDPSDNGSFQQTPPGLVLGQGELTKLVLRLKPYKVEFDGEAIVTLEVGGVNRHVRDGLYETFKEEASNSGRIRIWLEKEKKTLLIDSGDPEKRFFEWRVPQERYTAHLPGVVPRKVYVEGVKVSPMHKGDLRVLATVHHREDETEERNPVFRRRDVASRRGIDEDKARDWDNARDRKGFFWNWKKNRSEPGQRNNEERWDDRHIPHWDEDRAAGHELGQASRNEEILDGDTPENVRKIREENEHRFSTAYDHILMTVEPQPFKKDFVNGNVEQVWVPKTKQ